ncbi:MAG: TonB-dependent receptor, partial [Acidobacteria bacterium]|nr:TonB-dependent receptor [Acidobacteriota bacterium]
LMQKIFSVAVLLLLSTVGLYGQTSSAITGTILDQQGAAIAGAKITLRSVETNLSRNLESDGQGLYAFVELRAGQYEIQVEKTGFKKLVRQGVTLTVGEPSTIDLTMELGVFNAGIDGIKVFEPLVNTQTSELSYLVGERAIRELPLNGRNYTDLALLQPGVTAYPQRDGGSVVAHGLGLTINGQDIRSNVYLLDGTLLNDFTNGPAGSAAGTALGAESIKEFRVETNSYSAEFGRNFGGQINAISKSGANALHGSLYHFLRNDNMDARNFFDRQPLGKPEFKRNQFGGTVGGPIVKDKTFFFFGIEALRERLGRTVSTFVPDANARQGILPGVTTPVVINAAIKPFLDLFPLPNGANIGGGLARYNFGFGQRLDQNYFQLRGDQVINTYHQVFARYTFDDADQLLPTDFPQFPRTFLSRNQFATVEHTWLISPSMVNTARLGYSRTRVGQDVQADIPSTIQPFVPGRRFMGNIDIGGIPRFGPQSSVNVQLDQDVFSFSDTVTQVRGAHTLKFGGLVENYQSREVNPTFSLGIYNFPDLRSFLENRPNRFIGLTPEAQFDRGWRYWLLGAFAQDDFRLTRRLSVNLGLRYEFSSVPFDRRDINMPNLFAPTVTIGKLYQNPTTKNFSPRVGFAWDVFGDSKTSVRGGYGLYYNTNNQQNLIVTVTNPPATPRPVIVNPTFPNPPFARAGTLSIRPIEYDIKSPNVHVYNLNVQRQLPFDTAVTIGYAGSRGLHLWRNTDWNVPVPTRQADGSWFYANNLPRPNPAFSTIELKKSDGNSWYNALIFEVRKRFTKGVDFQSSYTFSRTLDTTQASTFFSDATNGTVSALPEVPGLNYNKGLADFHAAHNWVVNFNWEIPFAKNRKDVTGKLLGGWNLIGIGQMRSGNPLTVFVSANRSQSKWNPSNSASLGFDRPSLAAGYTYESAVLGRPDQYFDPKAFVLQASGTLGNT